MHLYSSTLVIRERERERERVVRVQHSNRAERGLKESLASIDEPPARPFLMHITLIATAAALTSSQDVISVSCPSKSTVSVQVYEAI